MTMIVRIASASQDCCLVEMATNAEGYGAILRSVYALESAACVPFADCKLMPKWDALFGTQREN